MKEKELTLDWLASKRPESRVTVTLLRVTCALYELQKLNWIILYSWNPGGQSCQKLLEFATSLGQKSS